MTDPTPEPTPDLGPEDIEVLRARLAAPAPPPGALEAARAAAMDAFDETHGSGSPLGVRDIRSARSASWYERIPLGAAAAVLAVVLAVGVVTQIDLGGDDDMAASSSDDVSSEDSGDGEAGAALDRSAEDAMESEAPMAAPESDVATASYDDIDTLVEAYRDRFGSDSATGDDASTTMPTTDAGSDGAGAHDDEGFPACDAAQGAGVAPLDVVTFEYVGLRVDGTPTAVIVVLYESEETGVRIAVLDEASCTRLDDRAL